jgi:hypothetical protein
MSQVTPNVMRDDRPGDERPVITAPEVEDLDLDLGSVMSPGIVDSPVGDGEMLDVDLGVGSEPVGLGDDGWVSDDLGIDATAGDRIDPGGGDVDFGGDDFGIGGDDDLGITDLGGGVQMPEFEVPEPTDFQQAIEAADSTESSLDDLFGDLG